MTHYDEGTIHAWLDGALNDEETAAIERHVASCGECAARVTEARGLLAGASRILLALDDVPGGVVPAGTATTAGTAGKQRLGRRWMGPAAWAIAATLVVAVGIETVGRFDGRTVGRMETATTTQTAATTPTTAPAQISGEAAKKVQDGGKAADALRAQPKAVSAEAAPTTRKDAPPPPPPEALVRKTAPALTGVAGGMAVPSNAAAATKDMAAKTKTGDSVAAPMARQMAAADSLAARRADAMRGQAMSLSNVVVTGLAETAPPAAAPTAQLRGESALDTTSPRRMVVCYTSGVTTLMLDTAAVSGDVPGWHLLRDDGQAIGRWRSGVRDSITLMIERPAPRVLRGVVAPAGLVVEGRIWTRTACRTVGP